MSRTVLSLVLWIASGAVGAAQDPAPGPAVFSRDAIARVVSDQDVRPVLPQDSRSDWFRLRTVLDKEIVVDATGLVAHQCRLVAVDDATMTVADLDRSGSELRAIPKSDVRQVRYKTGRSGSVLGAILGGAIGAGLGFATTVKVINSQCFSGCAGNTLVSAASLVGLPVAGVVLGYRAGRAQRGLTTIYVQP